MIIAFFLYVGETMRRGAGENYKKKKESHHKTQQLSPEDDRGPEIMIVVIVGPLAASVLRGVPPGPRPEAVPLGELPARPALPLVLHQDGRVVRAGVASVEAVGPRAPVGGLGVGEGGGHGPEGEGIAGRLRGRLVGEVEVGAWAGAEAVTREAAASVDNVTVGAVPV